MLKKEITYDDFEGVSHTDTFYFNISKVELIELEAQVKGGFKKWIEAVVKAEDNKTILEEFKKIILKSYGEKSDDGMRFIKTPEIQEAFSQTNAFSELYLQIMTDEAFAANFIMGILPKDMAGQIAQQVEAQQTGTPAPVAEVPTV